MRDANWEKLRDAFCKRDLRPTYADLSAEFGVPASTIGTCAVDEGWPALRARYMESQLVASDANSVLLNVVRGDKTVTTAYLSLAIVTLATLSGIVEEVRASDKAPSTRAETINTCMFAAKNLADSLRSVGILGAGKLISEGKEANGRWNPEILQQINVTVQNLQAQAKPPASSEVETVE